MTKFFVLVADNNLVGGFTELAFNKAALLCSKVHVLKFDRSGQFYLVRLTGFNRSEVRRTGGRGRSIRTLSINIARFSQHWIRGMPRERAVEFPEEFVPAVSILVSLGSC